MILEDNAIEITLGEAEEYTAVTEAAINALDVSQLPLFRHAGFSGEVYLGIIANSPHLSECADYLAFLAPRPRPYCLRRPNEAASGSN